MNDMVKVSGGSFLMGRGLSDAAILQLPRRREVKDLEHRVRRPGAAMPPPMTEVFVSSFWMSRYPVTQGEWEELSAANPSHFQDPDRPVEGVTWRDAVEFCNKRSLRECLSPCYGYCHGAYECDFAADGYRLPTEAEWEFAAGGGKFRREYVFPGGNDVDLVAWHALNAGHQTHPVGEKRPNELGLYDLAGNVWELCWDWYKPEVVPTPVDPVGPQNPAPGARRVVKGGCFGNSPHLLYTGRRLGRSMQLCNDHLGFRMVRRSAQPIALHNVR